MDAPCLIGKGNGRLYFKVSTPPTSPSAPGVGSTDRVVMFDGVCKLCGAWANFLIRFDTEQKFKLASMQSEEGQLILAWYNLPTDHFDSMALVEGLHLYTKSSAFLRIMRRLPLPWALVSVFGLVPRVVRDWFYERIADNRYRLFGKFDTCLLPTPEHEKRFLQSGSAK